MQWPAPEDAAQYKVDTQRVQVSLWCILIGYFGALSIYHNDTWTLWEVDTISRLRPQSRYYSYGSFRKLGVLYFVVLVLRIILFRVLCWGRLFSKLPYTCLRDRCSFLSEGWIGSLLLLLAEIFEWLWNSECFERNLSRKTQSWKKNRAAQVSTK